MKKYRRTIIVLIAIVISGLILGFTPLLNRIKSHMVSLVSTVMVNSKNNDQVPREALNWELNRGDGTSLIFQELNNKVVIINFWATWCRPCIEEMPSFQKLYDKYRNDVTFLFVAQDDIDKVNNLLSKNGFSLPIFYSKSSIPNIFYSRTIPTTYVIDKSGKIVLAKSDSADWNSEEVHLLLDQLLLE